jgi:predicted transcriptional regulator
MRKNSQKLQITDQDAYLAAIDEALAEADKGVFFSGEAVIEWLESWGTDHVKPTPEPDIFLSKEDMS